MPVGRRLVGTLALLTILLIVVAIVSMGVGSVAIAPADVAVRLWWWLRGQGPEVGEDVAYDIIVGLRLSRTALGILVGLSLGSAGAALQGLLRNPLAEPYVIGVSAGAALGAVAVVCLGWEYALGGLSMPAGAFVAAVLTLGVVYTMARRGGRMRPESFLLAGAALGAFSWAAMTVALSINGQALQSIIFWMLGSLKLRDEGLVPLALVAAVAWPALVLRGQAVNLLSLGEEQARGLGVSVERTRGLLIALAALLTAASVAVSGVIAFVGLVVPHILRRLIGPDHRILLPASGLAGACFLLLADTGARVIPNLSPLEEIPVGAVTALIGAPFFLLVLRREMNAA